jgi:hypothetical protein
MTTMVINWVGKNNGTHYFETCIVSMHHPSIHIPHGALIVHSELGHDKLHMNQTEPLYIQVYGFFFFQSERSKTCEPIICKAFYKRLSVTLKAQKKHTHTHTHTHRVREREREKERERERERRKNPFTLTQERWVGTNLPAKKHMTVNPMHEVLKKL